ncbi:MAG: PHP domain-containing protein [Oscillospiraceae bacterium]|nr:PHP domain-containing protein [Oscillospiraceae bacterium]
MLVDLHAHSSGISPCCRIGVEEVIRQAKEVGLDGIVLTNHYQRSFVDPSDPEAFVRAYVAEYKKACEAAEKMDFRVFFGVEVTMDENPVVHLLVYGVEEEFLLANPMLFACSQKDLYTLVHQAGGALIQAHPFRNGATVLDPQYLDGIEINCHPLYLRSYAKELQQIAAEKGLMLTCGGDYHADTIRPKCGVFLPDEIATTVDLADFLRKEKRVTLCIQEPTKEETYLLSYQKAE